MKQSNLVLGTSIGYNSIILEPFAKSLRKYYDGHIAMLVKEEPYERLKQFFEKYNIQYFLINDGVEKYTQDQICSSRHTWYRDILEKNFLDVENILMTDTRDVVFQADPFDHEITTELEFFLETKKYKDDHCEVYWFKGGHGFPAIYPDEVFDKLADEMAICAGTTIGTREGIIKYLDKMIVELNRLYVQRGSFVPDQPSHGYLIYNNEFPNHKKYATGNGPVATMNDLNNFEFNAYNHLLNDDGTTIAVLHQWDRTSKKELIYNKAMEII